MSKQLPERPHMDHLREQAKDFLAAYRRGVPDALSRLQVALPHKKGRVALHDAQSAIAREYGFASWRGLVEHVDAVRARSGISQEVADRFVQGATVGNLQNAEMLLELHPRLPKFNIGCALVSGEVDVVRKWLKEHPVDEKLDDEGWVAMDYACYSRLHQVRPEVYDGLEATVRLLLDRGGDPNTGHAIGDGSEGKLPILYGASCVSVHRGITALLLEKGAETNDGESVFHAAQGNLRGMLEMLVEAGADISSAHSVYGNTPLYFLSGYKLSDQGADVALKGCEWLMEHGADPNVPSLEVRETPLHGAARAGNYPFASLLLAHDADPNAKSADGRTPYSMARVTGNEETVRLLVEAGADSSLSPSDEFLSLCASGDIAGARRVLESYLGLIESESGMIVKFAELGLEPGVRSLLELGWDPSITGAYGATALHWSSMAGSAPIVKLLLEHGARLDIADDEHHSTPLGWALFGAEEVQNPAGDYVTVVRDLLAAGSSREALQNYLAHADDENGNLKGIVAALEE